MPRDFVQLSQISWSFVKLSKETNYWRKRAHRVVPVFNILVVYDSLVMYALLALNNVCVPYRRAHMSRGTRWPFAVVTRTKAVWGS
jgi:hypothetical protein